MTESTLPINTDTVLVLGKLKNRAGTLITNATVTLQSLVDKNGADVSGIAPPLAFAHVGDGVYELAIPDTIGVVAGETYKATVRAVAGPVQREWTETLNAKVGEA